MRKPRTLNRLLAKLIDGVIMLACAALLPRIVGPLAGFLYSLLADGFRFGMGWRGQSVGKKIFKLRVVRIASRLPGNLRDSAIRNAPVGFAAFFAIIPVWGWAISLLVGIPLFAIELALMLGAAKGSRLGDAMADTEVEME